MPKTVPRRHFYQVQISPELDLRLQALKKRVPHGLSPAPMVRTGLESYCKMLESALDAAQKGVSDAQLKQVLSSAFSEFLVNEVLTTLDKPKEVKGSKKKARS